MYKNLISKIAEQEAIKLKAQQKELANQKRIAKAKYNIENLYVGYVAKIISVQHCGEISFKRLSSSLPRIFKPAKTGSLQDIETEKIYEILNKKQTPIENKNYIIADCIQRFDVACIEVLENEQIETNAKLTKAQLREILDKQSKLDLLGY